MSSSQNNPKLEPPTCQLFGERGTVSFDENADQPGKVDLTKKIGSLASLIIQGYFRQFNINPTDISRVVARYLPRECLISSTKSNVKSCLSPTLLVLRPKLSLLSLTTIPYFEIQLYNNNCHVFNSNSDNSNSSKNNKMFSYLECGVIAVIKDSGFSYIDYIDDFEKILSKSSRTTKSKKMREKNKLSNNLGSEFIGVREQTGFARTAHFAWKRECIIFYNNNTPMASIDDNEDETKDCGLNEWDSIFIRFEKIASKNILEAESLRKKIDEQDRKHKASSPFYQTEDERKTRNRDDRKAQEDGDDDDIDDVTGLYNDYGSGNDGLYYMFLSKKEDFSSTIGESMKITNAHNWHDMSNPQLVHSLNTTNGGVLLDFDRYDYYFAFTMMQCKCKSNDNYDSNRKGQYLRFRIS